jgi:hypothetical protein
VPMIEPSVCSLGSDEGYGRSRCPGR